MAETRRCPECGTELPADAPNTPCPVCLMKLGLESWAEKVGENSGTDLPTTQDSPPGSFEAPQPEELAGRFPHLEILELLGQGGMGAVYKARQTSLDRLVALKIIKPDAADDPDFAERFAREAKALARLSHQNIVTVHDFGRADGLYYFVMEFIDGANLRQMLEAGSLEPHQALEIIPHICDALQFAHDEGIVHRDIKPENILIDKKGRVSIADFGLAKLMGRGPGNFTLTGTRQVMGTPRYMAPEQIEGSHEVDHRADIYSLGVVFYEMLTGELPLGRFEPPSKKVQVDVRLDEVVLRTLETKPERRYQKASDVKTDVEAISSSLRPAVVVTPTPPPVSPADRESIESARQQVRGPAVALMVTGALNWIATPIILLFLTYTEIGSNAGSTISQSALATIGIGTLVLSGFLFLAAFLMMRLRGYWLCIVGSILAMISTPGNLIGLPIGIWALVVLSQRDLRQAFRRTARDVVDDAIETTFGRRPKAVTVFGILSIVLGTLLVGATSLETFGVAGSDDPIFRAAERSEIYRVWRTVVPAIDFVSSYVLLVSGIGLLLLKRWARIGLLGFSFVQIALCLIEFPLVIVMMSRQGTEVWGVQGLTQEESVFAYMAACVIMLSWKLVYPILAIVFMNRPHVVAAFGLGSTDEPSDHSEDPIARQLRGPATGLVIAGSINCLCILGWVAMAVVGMSNQRVRMFGGRDEYVMSWLFFSAVVGIPILFAAFKMLQAEGYRASVFGASLAILPITPGALIGIPMGLWALAVLTRRDVKSRLGRAGDSTKTEPADDAESKAAERIPSPAGGTGGLYDRESEEASVGKPPVPPTASMFRQVTGHWAGRLGLLVTAVLTGYAGYKLFLPDVSEAMWTVVMVLCLLSFLVDVLRHPARLKGLQAVFPLLTGLTAMLIYFLADPLPLLNGLYRISDSTPSKDDPTFLRVVIGFIVVWMIWQMVQVRKKIASQQGGTDSLPDRELE